jgi:hypothetical protein
VLKCYQDSHSSGTCIEFYVYDFPMAYCTWT